MPAGRDDSCPGIRLKNRGISENQELFMNLEIANVPFPAGRVRVLTVGAEEETRRDIACILQRLGYQTVGHAAPGKEAVELADRLRPDVVLMDDALPENAGFDAVANHIRGHFHIPVVFLGSAAEEEACPDERLTTSELRVRRPFQDPDLRVAVEIALYRRLIEDNAQAAHASWQATFDAMNDAVCLVDLEGRILRANRAMGIISQMDTAALIGRRCHEVVHRVSHFIPECPLLRMRESRRRESLTLQVHERWLEFIADPFFDDSGRLIGAVHIIADIADHKRAEALSTIQRELAIALSAATRMNDALQLTLQAVLDMTGLDNGGIFLVDPESGAFELAVHQGVSDEFARQMSRFDPDSLWGELINRGKPIYAPDGAMAQPLDPALIKEGLTIFAIIPVVHGNKVIASLHVASRRPSQFPEISRTTLEAVGSQLGSVIARLRAEEETRRSQAELDATYTNAPVILCLLDPDLRMRRVNKAAVKFSGRSEESLMGLRVGDLLGCPNAESTVQGCGGSTSCEACLLREVTRVTLDTGKSQYRVEVSPVLVSGQTRREVVLLASTSAIRVENRSMLVLCLEDITERRRAEEAQARLEKQLRQSQKMEAIGTLAGGIAHDFNNILGAILGNAELARMDLDPNHPALEWVSEIDKVSRRAADLVKQILAFSRQQDQRREIIQLQPVLQEALKLLRSAIPATVEIVSDIVPESPSVLAAPSQIHQIMMNLCTNAYHALPERAGRIAVNLAHVQVDSILTEHYPELREGPYLRLSVIDNGHGMDKATLERIFEPFFTTKPAGTGTGLGLSVVHGIVKSHEGAITVYSQPGQGTTFHIYFPACETEAETERRDAKPIPQGNNELILFVDDELPLVQMGKKVLNRLGYRVLAFTNAADALAEFAAQPDRYRLVITDLNMPGMNGVDLARQLLKHRPELPILLATGFSGTITLEGIRKMGIFELLLKPVTTRSLAEAVHQALSKTRQPPAGRR